MKKMTIAFLIGFVLAFGLSGYAEDLKGIIIDGNKLEAYDDFDTKRISITQSKNDIGENYYEINLYGQSGDLEGIISATDGQLNIIGINNLVLGSLHGDIKFTSPIDFQNKPIKRMTPPLRSPELFYPHDK